MDRDHYAVAPRLARRAADSILAGLEGQPWDPISSARLLDRFHERGGTAVLQPLIEVLQLPQREPLFAFVMPVDFANAITQLRAQNSGALGLGLVVVAKRFLLSGRKSASELVEDFLRYILDHTVIYPRGGLIQTLGGEELHSARPAIDEMLTPIIEEASQRLLENPSRKRLGMAAFYRGGLGVSDDLLGGD